MWQVIGHEWAVELLARALQTEHVAHTYLFAGPANTGKTHLARVLAAALNCNGAAPPCGECASCTRIMRDVHPDVTLLESGGDKLKIDQVRALQRTLALSPYEGRWRVCIIADFQLATVEAANALLKTLEEPPSRVVLILTTTDASLLLPTIVSRCQILPLRAVPGQQIERALVERRQLPEEQARVLARLAAGRVGWAIRAAQDSSILSRRRQRIEELQGLLSRGRAGRIVAAERLSERDDLVEVLTLWQAWWRDIALLCGGCEELVANLDYLQALRHQAQHSTLAVAGAALRGGEAALLQLEQNVNPRLALEVLLLSWPVLQAAAL
jgi:DNA polymerase III subunit delta'